MTERGPSLREFREALRDMIGKAATEIAQAPWDGWGEAEAAARARLQAAQHGTTEGLPVEDSGHASQDTNPNGHEAPKQ